MNKKNNNLIKLVVTIVIIIGFVWFLVVSPMLTFHGNEKKIEEAAKRYFDIHSNALPTGSRVKTLSLKELYDDGLLKGDMYVPNTKKVCSMGNSWVKVRKEDNLYRYFVYLECGMFKSRIDHEGPEIKINGAKEITLGIDEEYKEQGVASVVDKNDGKLKVEDVTIKSNVDTSKVGNYTVEYIAFDDLKNKSVATREVNVVKTIGSTVKKLLNGETLFKGSPTNNYVRFSNVLYQVYGVTGNNVILVSAEDIGFANYSKLDEWLDYYYNLLEDEAKNMIVSSKFCNMQVDEVAAEGIVDCNSYTKRKKIYVPSVVDINKARVDGSSFMETTTMSWVSNTSPDGKAYLTRNFFNGEGFGRNYMVYDVNDVYGVRPMLVIKGSSLITSGDGSREKPFVFSDFKKGKGGTLVNERKTGEYLKVNGLLYRIIGTMKDGTTKVIANESIDTLTDPIEIYADLSNEVITYNPKDKKSVAYFINNSAAKYYDTSYFARHSIEVPIYKDKFIYGKEIKTKKYDVLMSAPNMFEIFSTKSIINSNYNDGSYWLLNTSNAKNRGACVYDAGNVVNSELNPGASFGVRIVAYLKKDLVISNGDGSFTSPYVVK